MLAWIAKALPCSHARWSGNILASILNRNALLRSAHRCRVRKSTGIKKSEDDWSTLHWQPQWHCRVQIPFLLQFWYPRIWLALSSCSWGMPSLPAKKSIFYNWPFLPSLVLRLHKLHFGLCRLVFTFLHDTACFHIPLWNCTWLLSELCCPSEQ